MGIRGHIQTTQPRYDGDSCLSSWLAKASWEYLIKQDGIDLYTGNDYGADSDYWEINFSDYKVIERIVKDLREHTDALDEWLEDELKGRGDELADLLEEGLEIAHQKGYWTIAIDWF